MARPLSSVKRRSRVYATEGVRLMELSELYGDMIEAAMERVETILQPGEDERMLKSVVFGGFAAAYMAAESCPQLKEAFPMASAEARLGLAEMCSVAVLARWLNQLDAVLPDLSERAKAEGCAVWVSALLETFGHLWPERLEYTLGLLSQHQHDTSPDRASPALIGAMITLSDAAAALQGRPGCGVRGEQLPFETFTEFANSGIEVQAWDPVETTGFYVAVTKGTRMSFNFYKDLCEGQTP
jgi:hypothetical protein